MGSSSATRTPGTAIVPWTAGVDDGSSDPAARPDWRETERQRLTANRVIVTTDTTDAPTNHSYAVDYVVGVDTGTRNIEPSGAAYLVPGTFDFTYDEDR